MSEIYGQMSEKNKLQSLPALC